MEANKGPFSYLFINLILECVDKIKYLSDLFVDIQVYIPDGMKLEKLSVKWDFKCTKLMNNRKKLTKFRILIEPRAQIVNNSSTSYFYLSSTTLRVTEKP